MTNDDFEAFLYKVDGDGVEYACANYAELLDAELRIQATTIADRCRAFTERLSAEADKRGLTTPWD